MYINQFTRIQIYVLWFVQFENNGQNPHIHALLPLVGELYLRRNIWLYAHELKRDLDVRAANRHLGVYLRECWEPRHQNFVNVTTHVK